MEPTSGTNTRLYNEVESYPWSTDPEFQSGLRAILGPDSSTTDVSQIEDLTLRARCFYYTRKFNVAVDFPSYKVWREAQSSAALSSLALTAESLPPPSSPDPSPRSVRTIDGDTNHEANEAGYASQVIPPPKGQPEYPASFAEVMELIKTGQPIPGIKDIPDTILVGQGSEATMSKRKKPWEGTKEGAGAEPTAHHSGLFTSPPA